MINWHRITKDNFTEFLSEYSLEEIKENGIVVGEEYSSYENDKHVFLSDKNCIVTEAEIVCLNSDGTVDCNSFRAECLYHNLTHFALRSEYEAILPKDKA
jgi:hypothetical protein